MPHHLSVVVQPTVREALEKEARRRRVTVSEVARDALQRGLGLVAPSPDRPLVRPALATGGQTR